jgi:hypothetical protein
VPVVLCVTTSGHNGIGQELFAQQRRPRFGNANPERMRVAFWEWMIRGDESTAAETEAGIADLGTTNATSLSLTLVLGNGIGPLSVSSSGVYNEPYPQVQFETDVGASESTCHTTGVGCLVPPRHAQFYPFYSLSTSSGCALQFGNLSGADFNNFGGDAQYGTPNLAWFFGTNSGGVESNPYPKS